MRHYPLTFETFVIGPTNEVAYRTLKKVGAWDRNAPNLVFLLGPYGSGKTHLLRATAHLATATAGKRVRYLSSEQLLKDIAECAKRAPSLLPEYLKDTDLLLVDDIHRVLTSLSRPGYSMRTFISSLVEGDLMVVIAAEAHHSFLKGEGARLLSGVTCYMNESDQEVRLSILSQRAKFFLPEEDDLNFDFSSQALELIAGRFQDPDVMIGALQTVINAACHTKTIVRSGEITLEDAKFILRSQLGNGPRITVDMIQKETADYFGLKQADLLSERRTRAVARPRQVAMFLAKKMTTRSLPDIGRRFGGRDHTTVLHAVRRIEELRQTESAIEQALESVERRIRSL